MKDVKRRKKTKAAVAKFFRGYLQLTAVPSDQEIAQMSGTGFGALYIVFPAQIWKVRLMDWWLDNFIAMTKYVIVIACLPTLLIVYSEDSLRYFGIDVINSYPSIDSLLMHVLVVFFSLGVGQLVVLTATTPLLIGMNQWTQKSDKWKWFWWGTAKRITKYSRPIGIAGVIGIMYYMLSQGS